MHVPSLADGTPPAMVRDVPCALLASSVNSLVGTIHAPFLVEAVRRQLRDPAQVVELARLILDPADRFRALVPLLPLPLLPESLRKEVEALVWGVEPAHWSVEPLAALPVDLAAPFFEELEWSIWREKPEDRRRREDFNAGHPDLEELQMEMDDQWGREENEERAAELLRVAPYLPDGQRSRVLQQVIETVEICASGAGTCWLPVGLLADAAPLLSEAQAATALCALAGHSLDADVETRALLAAPAAGPTARSGPGGPC
jgi:hypothetical protein